MAKAPVAKVPLETLNPAFEVLSPRQYITDAGYYVDQFNDPLLLSIEEHGVLLPIPCIRYGGNDHSLFIVTGFRRYYAILRLTLSEALGSPVNNIAWQTLIRTSDLRSKLMKAALQQVIVPVIIVDVDFSSLPNLLRRKHD